MTRPTAAWIGSSVAVAAVLLCAAGFAMTLAGRATGQNDPFVIVTVCTLCIACAIVGALIVAREPSNAIGWIFCGFGGLCGVSMLLSGYADVAPGSGAHGAGQWSAWVGNWAYVALLPVTLYVPLLFPDGRLPSPRWRVVAWLGGVSIAAFTVGVACKPGPLGDYQQITNPLSIDESVAAALQYGGLMLFVLAFLASVASVAIRYRSADELRRQQIKLLAAAAVFVICCTVAGEIIRQLGAIGVRDVLTVVGGLAFPVAIAVAMLRYRLYDVDRLISRSLTYSAVTLMLGVAYAGLVLVGQAVFSSFAGGSNLAIALSTLVVAALFLPLRGRVQRFVDRRFYRQRYDAARTLETFGALVRHEVDLDGLRTDLLEVVVDTMHPAHVSVWLFRNDPVTAAPYKGR
jgi:hypothetical protein